MTKKRKTRPTAETDPRAAAHASPRASGRLRIAMIAGFGSIMAFGVFGGFSRLGKTTAIEPFDAMPKASFIVATVDFAELRRSPMFDAIFGKDTPASGPMLRAIGVTAVAEACGFDPTTRIQRIAVSVPEEGERGEFGVAARVDVTSAELERCARSLSEHRGSRASTRDVGSFVVLDDKSLTGASAPRLGYGGGGLLVVGKGTWFDAMLGAADRNKPGARDAQDHVALRKSLTGTEGFRSPTVLVSAILPRSLRERLKGEMRAELGASDLSSAAMAGVLGVSAVGVTMHFGAAGQNIDALVELICDTAPACEAVEKLVLKKRADWSGDLALRMVGFGPVLDSLDVKRDGARLRVTASANGDALAATLERVMKLRGRGGRGGVEPPPEPRLSPPDETIPAQRDAGKPVP